MVTPNDLPNYSSSEVQAWLDEIESGREVIEEKFNWHGFAQGAAFLSRRDLEGEREIPDRGWATIAVGVYDRLAEQTKGFSRESFRHSSMMVRVSTIVRLGAVENDLLLDPKIVLDWFFSAPTGSIQDARDDAAKWRTLDISRIRELRTIKNRLNVVKVLVDAGAIPENLAPNDWLSIRQELP